MTSDLLINPLSDFVVHRVHRHRDHQGHNHRKHDTCILPLSDWVQATMAGPGMRWYKHGSELHAVQLLERLTALATWIDEATGLVPGGCRHIRLFRTRSPCQARTSAYLGGLWRGTHVHQLIFWRMALHVQGKMVRAGESALADTALEWLVSCVLAIVTSQLVRTCKLPLAAFPRTTIRLFARVGTQVSLEVAALSVNLATLLERERERWGEQMHRQRNTSKFWKQSPLQSSPRSKWTMYIARQSKYNPATLRAIRSSLSHNIWLLAQHKKKSIVL